MGTPKSHLMLGGRPVLHRVLETVATFSTNQIIVSAAGDKFDLPAGCQAMVIPDPVPFQGPLMGLHSGLTASTTETNVVVGCDMPFLSTALFHNLLNLIPGYDAVVPTLNGRTQQLHAVYSRTCLPIVNLLLAQGVLALSTLLAKLEVRYVAEDDLGTFAFNRSSFFNVNTIADLADADRMLRQSAQPHAGLGL